jgi:hypothetical protein
MRRLIAPLLLILLIVTPLPRAFAADLCVGAARTIITPPNGKPLAGYYTLRAADGVLDDLFSKAIVFEQDGTKAAVVVCDLLSLPRATVVRARELIAQQSGVPPANVMIAATHAHTGPVVARESSRDALDGGNSDLGLQYTAALPGLIARSVADAERTLAAARMSALRTTVENLAFNRRFWMADGTVGWNPPKQSEKIVAPAGPHDPEVGVLHFVSLEKEARPLVTLVNYAMHPDTTGGTRISADFPAFVSQAITKVTGGNALTVYANGTCGNLNHRNVWWNDPQKGPGETARLGNILVGAISAAWPRLSPMSDGPIRVASEIVKLPLPEISDADRKEAREVVRRIREPRQKFLDQVKAFRVLDVDERDGKPWEVEVQTIALGDEIAIVSLPGEIFVELGLALKARSPFKQTFIIELANGAIGYIPNASAYPEGNYEVMSARCAQGSGEMLIDTALRLLHRIKP